MQAIKQYVWGAVDKVLKLEENVPIPEVNSDEILVEVKAVSLNPVDWKTVEGKLSIVNKLPMIPGRDVSGVVTKVGSNATQFKVGDEVIGLIKKSGLAQYTSAPENVFVKKPQNISFEEAAALPIAGLTSYDSLIKARLQPGQKVLILGGSGGCGTYGVQIAKSLGLYVTATCSEKNVDLVKSLGADQVIDYTKDDWSEVLKGSNYDCVYDTIGLGWPNSHKILKSGGKYVTIAFDSYDMEKLSITSATSMISKLCYRKFVSIFSGPSYTLQFLLYKRETFQSFLNLVEEGKVKSIIDRVYPFSQFQEAFLHSRSGRARGKVIISVEKK